MRIRWLALTGTPGVGKSTLAQRLRQAGFEVLDGNGFAREQGCFIGVDKRRGSKIVDPVRVGRALRTVASGDQVRVLESHWAHAVPGMDAALVLRLRPARLRARLAKRRWSQRKIRENVEAEALDIILQECVATFGEKHVGELDTTRLSPQATAQRVAYLLRAPQTRLMKFEIGRIDWSEDILKWS